MSALKAEPKPVWQKLSIGIAKNGIGGNGSQSWTPKWPKPFKSTPIVSAVSVYSWFILTVSDVTAVGCSVAVRNINPDMRPLAGVWQDIWAYGELA
ncbi:hypothetical protein CS006_08045 [Bifidobacterium primatium]|uniref:Uncharacterized protein n=1 Tax=Bifidobacterium primatium TaxID=2045438 RepID=A0A2M9H8N0_9BIFI|nr:hypothetical protein [Bifidobacterium primatium]PJM73159.1 hypothetical protein CS006_08045 [Bifidobacterium primatium]